MACPHHVHRNDYCKQMAAAETATDDGAFTYVRQVIAGRIQAIVPHTSLLGAHHILSSVYRFSNDRASALMQRFMNANRIHRHEELAEDAVRAGFECAGEMNIDGWDGYYAQVAIEEGAETILTLDDDFDRIDELTAEVILSSEEFRTLDEFLGY